MALFQPALLTQHESIAAALNNEDRDVIEPALEVAFLASLQSNEGRPLEFALGLVMDPRIFSGAVYLNDPEVLNPETLKRLSPALNPEERCFVVAPGQSGLMVHGYTHRPFPSAIPPGTSFPPLVVVDGPGRVSLILKERRIEYDRGHLRLEGSNPLPVWMAKTAELVATHVSTPTRYNRCLAVGLSGAFQFDPAQWAAHGVAFRNHAHTYAPTLIADALRLIAKYVKAPRHGGALLVLPKGTSRQSVVETARWLKDGDQEIRHWMLNSVAMDAYLSLALEGHWIVDNLRQEFRDDPLRWVREVAKPRLDAGLLNLDFACRRCAHLTQIDGTTVLGDDLGVLAFGARLAGS